MAFTTGGNAEVLLFIGYFLLISGDTVYYCYINQLIKRQKCRKRACDCRSGVIKKNC